MDLGLFKFLTEAHEGKSLEEITQFTKADPVLLSMPEKLMYTTKN